MSEAAQAARLPDGRLHLHHGPIDLIVSADGPTREAAFDAARQRFESVLTELVAEMDALTRPYDGTTFNGDVARRMAEAVAPLSEDRFVTPMAAVAGAVADEILAAMAFEGLSKASVNNGGDIAFFLTTGQTFRAAAPSGVIEIGADAPARGLATSGWRGRSQSLGIADAVTVFAATAARADAAATLIANAVDLPGHPGINRRPAHEVEAIPQLGDRMVTVEVGPLSADETGEALARGVSYGDALRARGLILSASLLLNDETRLIGSEGSVTGLPADPF